MIESCRNTLANMDHGDKNQRASSLQMTIHQVVNEWLGDPIDERSLEKAFDTLVACCNGKYDVVNHVEVLCDMYRALLVTSFLLRLEYRHSPEVSQRLEGSVERCFLLLQILVAAPTPEDLVHKMPTSRYPLLNALLEEPLIPMCPTDRQELYIAAMSTSNYAFRYVGYPTAVLAKSCKLVPTMAMSIMIERKRYSLQEWIAAGCITSGIVLFNLSRISSVPEEKQDSLHGLILLIISLAMDGFLGSCQGLLKRSDVEGTRRPPTAMETMLYVNLYALVWIIPMAIQTGEWTEGMSRLDEIKHGMFLLNAAAASGQIFIFLTLTWFSPLVCTTITTTRKFFTILISVLHFGHVFNATQWSAIGLVFGGLYIGIANQARGKPKEKVA